MIRETLSRLVHGWWHHLPRSLYVAAVIASGVHILNSRNLPLELPATTLLAGVAQVFEPESPPKPDARRHMAVVEINDAVFERDFGRTSPLDRCQLRTALSRLVRNNQNIGVLAIDLDLSPTTPRTYQQAWQEVQRKEKTWAQTDTLQRCQYELEQFLSDPFVDDPAARRPLSIIAISPLKPTQGRDAAKRWDNQEHFPAIQFGDAELETRFGMAHDYEFPPPGYSGDRQKIPFAELITRALCKAAKTDAAAGQRGVDGRLEPPKHCEQVLAEAEPVTGTPPDFKTYPISHYEARYLYNRGVPVGLEDSPSLACPADAAPGHPPCDIRVVILGGTYGVEDQYLTPVGRMSGLRLHAVIAAQVRAHTTHWLGYLGDILTGGLILGPLVHWMWGGYYRQRTGTLSAGHSSGHPRTAYRWLLGLGFIYSLVVILMAIFSVRLYASGGVWISPLPMALAMLFESAVTGSVHAAVHKVEHEIEQARTTITGLERWISELTTTQAAGLAGQPPAQPMVSPGPTPWPAYLPSALAAALIAWAIFDLITH